MVVDQHDDLHPARALARLLRRVRRRRADLRLHARPLRCPRRRHRERSAASCSRCPDPPTAIFAANNRISTGVLRALAGHRADGLRSSASTTSSSRSLLAHPPTTVLLRRGRPRPRRRRGFWPTGSRETRARRSASSCRPSSSCAACRRLPHEADPAGGEPAAALLSRRRGDRAVPRRAASDDHVPGGLGRLDHCDLRVGALGLTMLPDGRLLRDAIAADPEGFLGPEHVAAFGPDPGVLVKLLDAGERLPVHLHPDRDFARGTSARRTGKSEAWLVLRGRRPSPRLSRRGRRRHVCATGSRGRTATAMLAALERDRGRPRRLRLRAGRTPHAIGEGVFIVEVQEPSDLGVMLEWHGFVARRVGDDGPRARHGARRDPPQRGPPRRDRVVDAQERGRARTAAGGARGRPPGGRAVLPRGVAPAATRGRARAGLRRPRRRRGLRPPRDRGGRARARAGRHRPGPVRRRRRRADRRRSRRSAACRPRPGGVRR